MTNNKLSKFVVDAVNDHYKKMIDDLSTYKTGEIVTYKSGETMKPFNLGRALAGDPLITRNGTKVTEFHHFKTVSCMNDSLIGIINGGYQSYNNEGKLLRSADSPLDLFMAPTTKTYYVNVYKDSSFPFGIICVPYDRKEHAIHGNAQRECVKMIEVEVEQ